MGALDLQGDKAPKTLKADELSGLWEATAPALDGDAQDGPLQAARVRTAVEAAQDEADKATGRSVVEALLRRAKGGQTRGGVTKVLQG